MYIYMYMYIATCMYMCVHRKKSEIFQNIDNIETEVTVSFYLLVFSKTFVVIT